MFPAAILTTETTHSLSAQSETGMSVLQKQYSLLPLAPSPLSPFVLLSFFFHCADPPKWPMVRILTDGH